MKHRSDRLRRVVGLFFAIALLGAFGPAGSRAQEKETRAADDARQAVYDAHLELIAAYAQVDIDALAGLMDPSDDLLIYHPRGNLKFSTLPSVRHGLERMLEHVGPSTWSNETDSHVVVSGDVAWHTYMLSMEWSGVIEPIRVRATEVWVHRASGWRLVHAHWSDSAEMSNDTAVGAQTQ